MFAAIALTLRARKDSKHVSPGIQVRTKAKDRMTVLKMAATQPAVEPVVETAPEVKA
jgi:NADH-quinone oxidoreductase subunit J